MDPRPSSLSNANVQFTWSTRSRILISHSPPILRSGWERNLRRHGHGKPDATVGPRKPNDNLLCLRILGRIAQCFLRDAVEDTGIIGETTPALLRLA